MRSDPLYFLRNLVNRGRGAKQELMALCNLGMNTALSAKHFNSHGVLIRDYGVLGRRMVTNVGVQFIVNAFLNTVEAENMNYHDCGTGTGVEALGDTALGSPWGGARVAGTQSSPSNGVLQTLAVITFNNTFAITEHGLFSASSVGVLFDRTKFAALNVASGDAIQFTYQATFNAGG